MRVGSKAPEYRLANTLCYDTGMACPFFEPQRRLDPGVWTHKPRLPLGDPYGGLCHAREPFSPEEEHQRELCNRGYARGACEHFPSSSAADAVRFSVTEDKSGFLRVLYVFEKEHSPLNHAELEISAGGDMAVCAEGLLRRQVMAFVESYRRLR
jgi:hypothetical protein